MKRSCWCDHWRCAKCHYYNRRVLYRNEGGKGKLLHGTAHLRAASLAVLTERATCKLPLFNGPRKDR